MKRLLLVIDYQNDFVDGALGFSGAELLHDPICQKIEDYKNGNDVVAFTRDTHVPEYLETQEGKNLPVVHCVKGTKGHAFYGRVEELSKGERVFEKYTFGSDALLVYLLDNPFDEIELVGLVSNICVLSNAVIAKTANPEATIYVDAQCTASFDPILHEKALDVLEGIQVKVVNRAAV